MAPSDRVGAESLSGARNSVGIAIIAVNWVLAAFSIAIVAARHHVRRNIIHRFGIEDYLIFVNLVGNCSFSLGPANCNQALALTMSSLLTVAASYGLGQHIQVLATESEGAYKIHFALKYTLLSLFFLIMAPCFGRISYAFLLLSIVGSVVWRKRFLWSIIVVSILLDFSTATVIYAQCSPISSFWTGRREDCLPATVLRGLGSFQGCELLELLKGIKLMRSSVLIPRRLYPCRLSRHFVLEDADESQPESFTVGVHGSWDSVGQLHRVGKTVESDAYAHSAMGCSIMETVHLQILPNLKDPTCAY